MTCGISELFAPLLYCCLTVNTKPRERSKVTLVTAVCDCREETAKFLASLGKYEPTVAHDFVIVDDGSEIDSGNLLRETFAAVKSEMKAMARTRKLIGLCGSHVDDLILCGDTTSGDATHHSSAVAGRMGDAQEPEIAVKWMIV